MKDETTVETPAAPDESGGAAVESIQPECNKAPAPECLTTVIEAAPQPPPLAPEEIEDLKARAAKAAEHWDKYLRAVADLENYRKRALRERQDTAKFATQSLMSGLLPVLDNLDAALAAASEQQGATLESMKMGVAMIRSQLLSALGAAGLVEIDAAGQPFDPNLHEALAQEECAETAEGHVLRQVRKGYKLHDRLLRPASVIVARKPAA